MFIIAKPKRWLFFTPSITLLIMDTDISSSRTFFYLMRSSRQHKIGSNLSARISRSPTYWPSFNSAMFQEIFSSCRPSTYQCLSLAWLDLRVSSNLMHSSRGQFSWHLRKVHVLPFYMPLSRLQLYPLQRTFPLKMMSWSILYFIAVIVSSAGFYALLVNISSLLMWSVMSSIYSILFLMKVSRLDKFAFLN